MFKKKKNKIRQDDFDTMELTEMIEGNSVDNVEKSFANGDYNINELNDADYEGLLKILSANSDFKTALPMEIDSSAINSIRVDSHFYTPIKMTAPSNYFALNQIDDIMIPPVGETTKLTFTKTPVKQMIKIINTQITTLEANLFGKRADSLSESEKTSMEEDLAKLKAQVQELSSTSNYLSTFLSTTIKDKNEESLALSVQNMKQEYELNRFNLEVNYKDLLNDYIKGTLFNSSFNEKEDTFILNTEETSLFMPYRQKNKLEDEGQVLGFDLNARDADQAVMHNFFKTTDTSKSADIANENTIVIGKSGAGKSFFSALQLFHALDIGARIAILDSENQFGHLTKTLGGIEIKFNVNNDFPINFLEFKESYKEDADGYLTEEKQFNIKGFKKDVISFLESLYQITARDLINPNQKNAISTILDIILMMYKVNENYTSLYHNKDGEIIKKPSPQISNIVDFLFAFSQPEKYDETTKIGKIINKVSKGDIETFYTAAGFNRKDAKELYDVLKDFSKAHGGSKTNFDVQTDTESNLYKWEDYPILNINIAELIKGLTSDDASNDVIATLIIQLLSQFIKKDFYNQRIDLKKVIVIDESWRYIKNHALWERAVADVMEDLSKAGRKRNALLWQITQKISEYDNPFGLKILAQCKNTVVFGADGGIQNGEATGDWPIVMEQGLTPNELMTLGNNIDRKIKGRFYIKLDSQWYYLQSSVSEYEKDLIDTSFNLAKQDDLK